MRLDHDVAPGVHRIEDAFTNWYLVEGDGRLTIVDTGVPSSWESLHGALAQLGRRVADVDAVVLTHAHFDHLGFAERARTTLDVPVYVHEQDVPLTRRPLGYDHERPRSYYFATQVRAVPIVASLVRHRAFWPTPVGEVVRYREGETLPVPGELEVIFTPGHTDGHCSLLLPGRDAVIVGDALVTLDPYTGLRGPRIVAAAATADTRRNLDTLDAIADTGAGRLLVGHGDPWTGGAARAVQMARAAGAR
jgi:glyoxylase-like metal-dependent hydrolase (beta-lactamase superfamily II)